MQIYEALSSAINRLQTNPDRPDIQEHAQSVINRCMECSPSGAGIDLGTEILLDKSNTNRLVFSFSFHHMNDNGYYDGWTDHKLIVTPTFYPNPFDIRITGRDRNNIKDYLYEVFSDWLDCDA